MPGGGYRRRGGRGRGGQPRPISGFIEPALLLLLLKEPGHGYSLISGLQEIGFDDYPVDSSTIYRILRQLELQGMIASAWDSTTTAGPPRRVYRITPAGESYLSAWIADLRATERTLRRYLDAYDHIVEKSKRSGK